MRDPAHTLDDLPPEFDELKTCKPTLHRDLVSVLASTPPSDDSDIDIRIVESRSGAHSLTVNGRWVHSSVDPAREAQRAVAAHTSDGATGDGTIIVGIGLGYHLAEIGRCHEDVSESADKNGADHLAETAMVPEPPSMRTRPIVCIILHPTVLRTALQLLGPRWWCENGPDRIAPGWLPGVIVPILQQEEIRTFSVLTVRGETTAFPAVAREIDEALTRYRERVEVNRNTLHRFGPLWVRNTLHSVIRYGVLPGIDDLVGIAPGVPSVVCAAGPTLDDVLPFLSTLRRSALVIAVDTAIIALQRAGITPDLAVISDPQYWNTRHLDHVVETDAILVAEPATHPRTLRIWTGPRRVSASLFPLGSFFDMRTGRTHKLGAGGSVTTSAWDLARTLGSTSIALAGTDLGFPRYRTHCAGSFFETRLALVGTRLSPAEHGLWNYLHGARATMVPSVAGAPIPSDSRMHVYRSWFSEQSRQFPDVRTILLSPESSSVSGLTWQEPLSWMAECGDAEATRDARALLRQHREAPATDSTAVVNELRETIGAIGEVAQNGLAICRAIRRKRPTLSDTAILQRLRALDGVDATLATLADREVAGFIAAPMLEALSSSSADTPDAALEDARSLYQSLADAVRYHLELIQRYHRT